jgi:hypothetical protein
LPCPDWYRGGSKVNMLGSGPKTMPYQRAISVPYLKVIISTEPVFDIKAVVMDFKSLFMLSEPSS